jgi:surface antigen
MSLLDSRANDRAQHNGGTQTTTGQLMEQTSVDQAPFPGGPSFDFNEHQLPQLDFSSSSANQNFSEPVTPAEGMPNVSSSGTNQSSANFMLTPAVTQHLAQTGALAPITPMPSTLVHANAQQRQPVLIPSTGKKSSGVMPPRSGGRARMLTHISVATLLVVLVAGALVLASPISHGQGGLSLFQPKSSTAKNNAMNSSLVSQQAATATAVMQDGHDSGANTGQYGSYVPVAPVGANQGGLGRFFYGQCTYWANMRYHELSGHYVPWLGDAWQWQQGAYSYGWNVSFTPVLHSIIVLQPGVQGAGGYGHVAIVEGINPDGSVSTSNWNWAGSGAYTTYVTFRPGPGVSFLTY